MDIIEAHGRLAIQCEAGRFDLGSLMSYLGLDDDYQVALLTAAASLSGMLPDCETDEDLDAALRHFTSLYESEVITSEDLVAEMQTVIDEVCRWAEIAELN